MSESDLRAWEARQAVMAAQDRPGRSAPGAAAADSTHTPGPVAGPTGKGSEMAPDEEPVDELRWVVTSAAALSRVARRWSAIRAVQDYKMRVMTPQRQAR